MLAGLLFAIHDADDRPDRLAATLPFGGVTLIEYQARLLITAGASQIVVVVARLTPELLGALSRIARRGVTVDTVRSAGEAADKLHPLARVLMLADGLITTQGVVAMLAGEGGDALLVVDGAAAAGFERVGGQMAWAGVARLDPRRLAEVAAMPRDYDVQSTLVRLASQARAIHVVLPPQALRQGHGIEHHARTLEERGRIVLAAIVSQRREWFDRSVLAPVARLTLPALLRRAIPAGALAAGGVALGLGGLAAVLLGYRGTGLVLSLIGGIGFSLGATLAELRDEAGLMRAQRWAVIVLPALAALALAWTVSAAMAGEAATAGGAAVTLGLALVAIAALGERGASDVARPGWWGRPLAYLAVLTPFVVAGMPLIGLGVTTVYALATLTAVIETLRRQP